MAKHTPGPWTAAPYSSVVGCPITAQPDKSKNTILVAGTRSAAAEEPDAFRAEVEANGSLIAAAPDLLAALKLHLAFEALPIDRGGKNGPKGQAWATFISARDTAIAKAEPIPAA